VAGVHACRSGRRLAAWNERPNMWTAEAIPVVFTQMQVFSAGRDARLYGRQDALDACRYEKARTSVADIAPKGRDGLLPGWGRNDAFCLPRLKVVVRFHNLSRTIGQTINARRRSAGRDRCNGSLLFVLPMQRCAGAGSTPLELVAANY